MVLLSKVFRDKRQDIFSFFFTVMLYLAALRAADKLLTLWVGGHVVPQTVLANHLLAAQLADQQLALHVHHFSVHLRVEYFFFGCETTFSLCPLTFLTGPSH